MDLFGGGSLSFAHDAASSWLCNLETCWAFFSSQRGCFWPDSEGPPKLPLTTSAPKPRTLVLDDEDDFVSSRHVALHFRKTTASDGDSCHGHLDTN